MTTVGDRLYELGGVPVGVGSNAFPCVGNVFWVDGTSGLDSNSGEKPNAAKKTITAAITTQAAQTDSLGDAIYVMPGTYAESVTGALTKVKLIGASPGMVSVQPTASHAYTGALTDAVVSGIDWRTPSTSNLTYAAFQATDMVSSDFIGNWLTGTTDPVNQDSGTCGFQIGNVTEESWETMTGSRINHNVFKDSGNRKHELSHGIRFGYYLASTYASSRMCRWSQIAYNHLQVEYSGIVAHVNINNWNGSKIHHNWINSAQGGDAGTSDYGISILDANADTTSLLMVTENRVVSNEDAIFGVNANSVMGNIVGVNGATAAGESGYDA